MSARAKAYTASAHPIMQPRPASRYRFALTPLADAMFQLLIFFMLTSSLTPYSLLTVRTGAAPGQTVSDPGADPAEQEPVLPGENAQFWTVTEGQITANGQTFTLDQLPALAAALGQNDQAEVVLIMQESARVQDLTSVLEALTAAGVTSVQMARRDDA